MHRTIAKSRIGTEGTIQKQILYISKSPQGHGVSRPSRVTASDDFRDARRQRHLRSASAAADGSHRPDRPEPTEWARYPEEMAQTIDQCRVFCVNQEKQQRVLAAMTAGGEQASFDPAQIQKLLFLIDNEIPELIGGPHFDFKPHEYGPFDESVYAVLKSLHSKGCVHIDHTGQYPRYALTPQGFRQGTEVQQDIPTLASEYLAEASVWIRSLTFRQLLTAIYTKYPEMAINSIVSPWAYSAAQSVAVLSLGHGAYNGSHGRTRQQR